MSPTKSTLSAIAVFFVILTASACSTLQSRRPLKLTMETDSSQYTTYHLGIGHTGAVDYTFVNTTRWPISRATCAGDWPGFEKLINGRWVYALDRVSLACRIFPDPFIAPGQQVSGEAAFGVFDPGHNWAPTMRIDSVTGTYRLRWDFTVGYEAGKKGARIVQVTSNPFRLVERTIYSARDTAMVRILSSAIEDRILTRLDSTGGYDGALVRVVAADSLNPEWTKASVHIASTLRKRSNQSRDDRRLTIGIGIPKVDRTNVSVGFSVIFQRRCASGEWIAASSYYEVTTHRVQKWATATVVPRAVNNAPVCPP